jgi:hypothetical protein
VSNLLTEELHDADELGQYRSLSTLAIAAVVLGLCSPLALVAPILLAIPLLAIAVAGLALARIHASAASLTGRPLALAGIALGVVFAVAAPTHTYVRERLSIHHADESARRWLSLLSAGRIDEALELMTPQALMNLQPPPPTRDSPRPPFDRHLAETKLRDDPLVHALQPAQEGTAVQFFLSNELYSGATREPQVGCQFRATGAQAEDLTGSIVMSRKLGPQGEGAWVVDSWELSDR